VLAFPQIGDVVQAECRSEREDVREGAVFLSRRAKVTLFGFDSNNAGRGVRQGKEDRGETDVGAGVNDGGWC
jgi:hypothetical protein